MTDGAVATVVGLSIRELYPLHDLGERNSFRLDQEMNVVGHQNVGVNRKTKTLAVLFEPLEISQPVSVVVKDLLALIAPNNNVLKCPVKFDSGFSRHDR